MISSFHYLNHSTVVLQKISESGDDGDAPVRKPAAKSKSKKKKADSDDSDDEPAPITASKVMWLC